jgi:NADPH2:quinone reductase
MRAIQICQHGTPDLLRWAEVPDPAPGPGQVSIDVHAVGVNFPDLLVVAGTYQDLFPLPFTPGKEAAGIVNAVGPGVQGFRPGDRVMAVMEAGAYAEKVVVTASHCYRVPKSVRLDQAAALGVAYQTAYFALHERGMLRSGEKVLVTGASGGVGIAAVQLAKAAGAFVIATAGSADKVATVREAGANAVLDLSTPGLTGRLREEIRAITGGRDLGLVVDQVGGDLFDASLRCLAKDGRMLVVGFASGRIPTVPVNYLLLKQIGVIGVHWGYFRDERPVAAASVQMEIFRLAAARKALPPISSRFPLARASDALQLVAERNTGGKIVLTTTRFGEG